MATMACSTTATGQNRGILDVSWTAPTSNTDGTALENLGFYRVFYSTSDSPCPNGEVQVVKASAPRPPLNQTVRARLTGLVADQDYYVSVAAVNSGGVSSDCSSVSKGRARRN
jgi:hypothetical protein